MGLTMNLNPPTWIHGMTVQLQQKTAGAVDAFNIPTYSESWVDVDDVLVGQPTDAEQVNSMDLYGEKAVYVLGIPKGDTHDWSAGTLVQFFGETWRIFGHGIEGIEDLVPGPWNKKVMVASYGTGSD